MPPVLCRQPAARAQLAAAAVLLLLALTALAAPAAGQGVAPSTRGALRAPAAVPNQMASLYGRAAEFSAQFRRNRRAACRQSGGSLCSAGSGEGGAAVLAWLASPQRFDARDRGLVSRVGDQGGCNACMSFALVGAAEAALSAALGTNATGRAWSVQDLHFCLMRAKGAARACQGSGATDMRAAIQGFVGLDLRGLGLMQERCLPYTAAAAAPPTDLCAASCLNTDPDLGAGSFGYKELRTLVDIQAHIRQWGGVITRMDVFSDFRPFFERNPDGVYPGPGRGAEFAYGHVVLLVGYENVAQHWIVKSSWGAGFARGGFAKVSYHAKATGIASPTESFGLVFNATAPRAIPYKLEEPKGRARAGCYSTEPPAGTWLWELATALDVNLGSLISHNIDKIKAVDRPLDGNTSLVVCNVSGGVLGGTLVRGAGNASSSSSSDITFMSTDAVQEAAGPAQQCITLRLRNACPAGVVIDAAVVYDVDADPETHDWVTSSLKTIKPGESIEMGRMTSLDFYLHATVAGDANCDSGLCWDGDDLAREAGGRKLGFVKQELPEGTEFGSAVEWPVTCDHHIDALWGKACPRAPADWGEICVSYAPAGEASRRVTCQPPARSSAPQLMVDVFGSAVVPDWRSPVKFKYSSTKGDNSWQELKVEKYLSGYKAELLCQD